VDQCLQAAEVTSCKLDRVVVHKRSLLHLVKLELFLGNLCELFEHAFIDVHVHINLALYFCRSGFLEE